MPLNKELEAVIKKKESTKRNKIANGFLLIPLGTIVLINYMLSIFIGKFVAKMFNVNELYFLFIFLATLFNVYVVARVVKRYMLNS
jgi:hypothetical protein